MRRVCRTLALMLAFIAVPATVFAYDEATSPDLSNNPLAPTPLSLGLGNNQVKGTVRDIAPDDTRDYITFTIATGQRLSAIRLMSYANILGGGPANIGFHAINDGATSQNPDPNGSNEDFYLGGDHMTSEPPGTDLLPILADGEPAGTGFNVPLGPGTYTYLIQQPSGAVAYDLEFVVTALPVQPVPALGPWTGALLAALLALAALYGVRQRSTLEG